MNIRRNNLLFIVLCIAHGTLLSNQDDGISKVKTVLTSKPAMLVYGAIVGAGIIILGKRLPYFSKNTVSQQQNFDSQIAAQGKLVYEAVNARPAGIIEYFNDIGTQSNSLLALRRRGGFGTEYVLYVYRSDSEKQGDEALRKVQNNMIAYNKYLESKCEATYNFEYEYAYYDAQGTRVYHPSEKEINTDQLTKLLNTIHFRANPKADSQQKGN